MQHVGLWHISVTTAETGYTNDWISLQKIKHFEKYSARKDQDAYCLLLFYEDHKIKPVGMPPQTTHLLQLLDVCVFQPLNHWHSEAVNEAD